VIVIRQETAAVGTLKKRTNKMGKSDYGKINCFSRHDMHTRHIPRQA